MHVVPTAPLYGPSKLATDPFRDKADWPLTARTFFTRPDPRARRDVRFAQASTAYIKWSFKARL